MKACMSDFMLLVMKVRWIHAFCKGMSKYKKQFTIILVTDQVMHYFEKSSNLQKKDEIIKQISLKKLIQLALKSASFDYPISFWIIVPDPSLIYETNSSK